MSEVAKVQAEAPPAAPARRILAPDLARGLTLLGIALANVTTAWIVVGGDNATSIGVIINDSILDKVTVVLGAIFVHVRGLPMFTTLVGYGVGMITLSLWRRAYPLRAARRVLLRRYGLLAAFGVAHMVFLFFGDIMFMYGLTACLLALMMSWSGKAMAWLGGVLGVLYIVLSSLLFIALGDFMAGNTGIEAMPSFGPDNYFGHILTGLISVFGQVTGFIFTVLMLLPLMMVGFVAARHRVLSRVDEFRGLLWAAVGVSVAIMVFIGLPWGLAEIGVSGLGQASVWFGINQAVGPLSGPGFIAAIALAAQPLQRRINEAADRGEEVRLSLPIRALVALGKRSMSGYVAQSILFVILVMPFTFGFGIGDGAFAVSMIAAGVWLVTLILAYLLDIADKPGPFEWAHRRLSYGRNGLQEHYQPKQKTDALAAPSPAITTGNTELDAPQQVIPEAQPEIRSEPLEPDPHNPWRSQQ